MDPPLPPMDWATFVQFCVNGLTLGSVYALIALGYTMVYGILKLLNFAHGDVYMVGAFVGYGVLSVFGGPLTPRSRSGSLIVLMFAGGDARVRALSASSSSASPTGRYGNAPRIAPLISALGVSFFLQNSALLLLRRGLPQLRHVRPRSATRATSSDSASSLLTVSSCSCSSIVLARRADGRRSRCSCRGRGSARRCARRRSTARPRR